MLGRLAKWLRILGYDTLYPGQESDRRLAKVAAEQDRVLLTRDTDLALRKGFRSLLIQSNLLSEQLAQAVRELSLTITNRTFTLCLICNRPLKEADRDEVHQRVPPYVLRTQPALFQCPECHKIYWPGTHLDHMQDELKKLRSVLDGKDKG
jgi:uncharacterized protein with PIN domain